MRTLGIVTTSRADWGIYRPVLQRVREDVDLSLHLYVSGSHLSPEFGLTVRDILQEGFPVGERIEVLLSSDTPEGVAKSMGLGVLGFAQAFGRFRPDLLVVLGDRFEMHAAALAALPFKLPVAHIHGGEVTEGAIDEALRHSITKLSHVHFVATEAYARRVIQLGEEPWRVTVSGAPALDAIAATPLLGREALEAQLGFRLEDPFLLVTFHPATLQYERAEWQAGQLAGAIEDSGLLAVVTMPNADAGGRAIRKVVLDLAARSPKVCTAENMGSQGYFSLMALAAAMVGNSSSGIIEAASFSLPVVNVGPRQEGRIHPPNVVTTGHAKGEILGGIERVCETGFRDALVGLKNPYGTGKASAIIVDRLKALGLDERLIVKRFHDLRDSRGDGSR